MTICPVCGYNRLEFPYTEDGTICPSCGTEFGYDDFVSSRDDLRARWIEAGAEWWDADSAPPPDWDPVRQLLNVDYAVTVPDLKAIEHGEPVSRGIFALSANGLDPHSPERLQSTPGAPAHNSATLPTGRLLPSNTATQSTQSRLRFEGDRAANGVEYVGSA
jgi:hypothetical protein